MKICSICGKEFEKSNWYKPFDDVCSSECFNEKFWLTKEQDYLNGISFIIVDGQLFKDAGYKENPKNGDVLGFDGREFKIKMNDGTEIFTNNLWFGGKIPENHRKILKDNAVFV